MYYPYLRGKQFELIALREFATQFPNNEKIVPIIEPVKSSFNGLTRAIEVMFEKNLPFALILNPKDGDFKREYKEILLEVPLLSENTSQWIPAYLYGENGDEILSSVREHGLHDIMVIFKRETEWDDSIKDFLTDPDIKYIVDGKPDSRTFKRRLLGLGKCVIRLDNCFVERPRNVDYVNCIEEKFTEEHLFYSADSFYGISDYTVLPSDFIDGGMLPYAIAIHLTYKKNEEEIYIHHFVSDTNDGISNVQKKFFEAASKVKDFFADKDKTYAIEELSHLLDAESYPGLGVIKKLSIRNHFELMNRIMSV